MVDAEPLQFICPSGAYWSVHEITDPLSPTGRSLIFVSDYGFRRVRTYPPDWRELGWDALWALSWGR